MEFLPSWQDEGGNITNLKDHLNYQNSADKCLQGCIFNISHHHIFFFRPFPLNTINVTEDKPVGEIIARVKATDLDEDSSITYSFKTQQDMFSLDPCKF